MCEVNVAWTTVEIRALVETNVGCNVQKELILILLRPASPAALVAVCVKFQSSSVASNSLILNSGIPRI